MIQPYVPRETRATGIRHHRGWAVKTYSVSLVPGAFDASRFRDGEQLAFDQLPDPAESATRVGVAILITHQARDVDYAVIAWWDRENELPIRVFVSDASDGGWRPARGGESVCVWDLEVLWSERVAYVETVMSGQVELARERYLGRWAVES